MSDNTWFGIAMDGSRMKVGTFEECLIQRNTHGGVYFDGSVAGTFLNCAVTDHHSSAGGGGVRDLSSGGSLTFDGCTFARNSTQGEGGGVMIRGESDTKFIRCRFEGNTAAENGGGLAYYETFHIPDVPVQSCDFVDNVAGTMGGGLYFDSSSPCRFISNLFWNNSAEQSGGAVHLDRRGIANPQGFYSSTLVGNSAPSGAGILLQESFGQKFELDRTIIAFSRIGRAVSCTLTPDARCSDLFGNEGGDWVGPISIEFGTEGNLAADPQFCDIEQGDFRISETSPCAPDNSGGCGLIGLFEVGCGATAVKPSTWGSIKASFSK
jgi:hypothetical protein